MSEERRFPLLDRAGGSVPWAVVEPIREIAQRIHGQTLERLAERGGLSRYELGMELVGRSPLAQPPYDAAGLREIARLVLANEKLRDEVRTALQHSPGDEGTAT